jgi:hypothetical protein
MHLSRIIALGLYFVIGNKTGTIKSFRLSGFADLANQCGEFPLSYAAIFSLRLLGGVIAPPISIDETKQFQKIIDTKRGSARRDVREGILRHHVRHVAQKRLKRTGRVVVEDSILTPVESPRHQLVLGAAKRMKRMRYSEPTRGVSQTTCIRRLSTRPRLNLAYSWLNAG